MAKSGRRRSRHHKWADRARDSVVELAREAVQELTKPGAPFEIEIQEFKQVTAGPEVGVTPNGFFGRFFGSLYLKFTKGIKIHISSGAKSEDMKPREH